MTNHSCKYTLRQLSLIKGGHKLADSVTVPVREREGDGLLLGVLGSVGQHQVEVRGGVGEDEKVGGHSLPVTAHQPQVDQVAGGEEGEKGGGDPFPPFRERWQDMWEWRVLLMDLSSFCET